jgi:fused signal recognition particle receptor
MTGGGFFSSLVRGLSKTRRTFTERLDEIIPGDVPAGSETWDDLEELLITADIGLALTRRILDELSRRSKKHVTGPAQLREALRESLLSVLNGSEQPIAESLEPPTVVLVVGVNGTGKTTTIAKIARHLVSDGKSVLLAAGDTFRDAAIEQLAEWGRRLDIEVISQKQGADPAAVSFDALVRARARGIDYLFVDTAGRLHTKYNLMEELKKIKRVLSSAMPGAPHETLLVLDAGIGQNNIAQTKKFHEEITITGIVLTKLDGSAKGGALFPLYDELKVPIKYIGVGEGPDDLERFDRGQFVAALFRPD